MEQLILMAPLFTIILFYRWVPSLLYILLLPNLTTLNQFLQLLFERGKDLCSAPILADH